MVREPANEHELQEAFALRQDVFITEQRRERTEDVDSYDVSATHLVAVEDGAVVGTLRIYRLRPNDVDLKIGRVAVLQDMRGRGIGAALMDAAFRTAQGKCRSLYLHAQISVVGFYEKLGYVTEGDVFNEAGTPHVLMRQKTVMSTRSG